MRKIKEALRLHANGFSIRKIAASLGVGQSTASDYLKRVEHAGLNWPLAAEMTDAALEALRCCFIRATAPAVWLRPSLAGPRSIAS
jgi:predicted transcriptional regulator